MTYEWKGVRKVWRWTRDRMQRAHDEGRLVYTKSGAPRYKRYLDEMKGALVTTVWEDIPFINSQAAERLGYPTQKPEALLERIIKASSNEGDVVLDPFCGCGTTVQVAQRLNRRWIGIDITHLAIGLIKKRLSDAFGPEIKQTYDVIGEPTDYAGAAAAGRRRQVPVPVVGAGPGGRAARRTEEGRRPRHRRPPLLPRRRFRQIEADHLFSQGRRRHRLAGSRPGAACSTARKPRSASFSASRNRPSPCSARPPRPASTNPPTAATYPRLQILTIQQILDGKQPDYPPHRRDATFKKAPRSRPAPAENLTLPLLPPE